MSAILLNCNCQKRISFNLTGGHLLLTWSEFFDIFIVSTLWFIISFFNPHIAASRSRDGWRMAISICAIFCRFFFFYFHSTFHSHFQIYFWSRIQSKHPFCNSRGSDILFRVSFVFPLVCSQKGFVQQTNLFTWVIKETTLPTSAGLKMLQSAMLQNTEILTLVKII